MECLNVTSTNTEGYIERLLGLLAEMGVWVYLDG